MAIPLSRATVFAEGLDHPECIAAHPDGSFYAGGESGQIYHISADGKRVNEIARSDGGFILGVAVSPDGSWLAICDLRRQCVWKLELSSRTLSEFASGGAHGESFGIPNHLAFAPDGSLFVTDSGAFRQLNGRVFRFDCNGDGGVWHSGPFSFANGIAMSPKGDAVYVVCSWLPGVERIELRPDGSAGKRSVFVRMPKTVPDGLAFDLHGNLYVSCYAPSRIYKVTPRKKLSMFLDDWEAHTISNPTNIAFGVGRNAGQMFAANIGRWHITKIDARVQGLPLGRSAHAIRGGAR